jgi:putative membrane protein
LRKNIVKRGGWLFFIVASICLAFSALYELFEWRVALASGSSANDFLGTQGDAWDTQEDMATCLVGAIVALVTLSGVHDRQLPAEAATAKSAAS